MVAGQGQGAASVDHSVEGSSTAISTTTAGPETPRYATGGPVSYPSSSSMYTSPTTTASSAFSQVRPCFPAPPGVYFVPQQQPTYTYPVPDCTWLIPRVMQGGGYPGSTDASSHMASSGSYYSHSSAPSYDSSVGYPQTSQPIHNYSYAQDSSSYYGFAPPPTIQDQQQYAVQGYNNDFYPSESSYGHQPTASGMGDFSMPAYASTSPQQFGAVGGVVYTEQRGIHIREISRRASDDQVRKMIRDAVGSDSDLITEIEVPLDKDRTPRGWATAHFRSAEMAQRMVRQLNRYEFKGRPLQVRLLKEGETIGTSIGGGHQSSSQSSSRHNGSSSKHHHSSSSRKDDGRKDRGHKEKTVAPNTHAKASGSSLFSSTSSSSKDKGKGKEKDSGSTSSKKAVVIADGSSGRKHRSS